MVQGTSDDEVKGQEKDDSLGLGRCSSHGMCHRDDDGSAADFDSTYFSIETASIGS